MTRCRCSVVRCGTDCKSMIVSRAPRPVPGEAGSGAAAPTHPDPRAPRCRGSGGRARVVKMPHVSLKNRRLTNCKINLVYHVCGLGMQNSSLANLFQCCPFGFDSSSTLRSNGHETALQLVSGANFGPVLHHFSSSTRLDGSQGQVWPEIGQQLHIQIIMFIKKTSADPCGSPSVR